MSHTKEPWVVGQSRQFGFVHFSVDETSAFAPRSLALTGIVGDMDEEESIANARRIVACVNACAGIPTEQLEGVSVFERQQSFRRDYQEMKKQRDELLDVASRIPNWVGGEWADELRAQSEQKKGGE